ncbi:MAG: hypothetical protein AB7O21_01925 [Gammaproteobacteria bacterium]
MIARACPSCGQRTIPVWKLMFWRVRCRACGADVGTHPAWRLPLLSVEMVAWLLALNVLTQAYGRSGQVASLAVWALVDYIGDCYVPLVARRR